MEVSATITMTNIVRITDDINIYKTNDETSTESSQMNDKNTGSQPKSITGER